jgi:glutathione S-transferase
MSDDLVLYYNPMSRARIVHWMLEEVGAPYRLEVLRFDKREHKAEKFLAVNPMGKLPALVHRGLVVTETAAICAYLADAFPQAGLAPPVDSPLRGTYYRWLFFAAASLEYASVDKSLGRVVDQPARMGYGTYEDTLAAVERALTPGPFVLGEQFSAADVYLGSQLAWGMMVKSIEPRAVFNEYNARLMARPAFARMGEQANKIAARLTAPS